MNLQKSDVQLSRLNETRGGAGRVIRGAGGADERGMDESHLWVSLFFGALGAGMFLYGKKAGRMVPLGAGLGLLVVPYFIPNVIVMAAVGCVMAGLPWVVRES
jgi:hypothetical protein